MSDEIEFRRRMTLLMAGLGKLYALVEISEVDCPLCGETEDHTQGCPVRLAWSLLSDDAREVLRARVREIIREGAAEPLSRALFEEPDEDWPDVLSEE